jgi:hypothetical protein
MRSGTPQERRERPGWLLPLLARASSVRRKPRLHLAAQLVPSRVPLEWNFKQCSPPASGKASAGRSSSATSEHDSALMPAPAAQPVLSVGRRADLKNAQRPDDDGLTEADAAQHEERLSEAGGVCYTWRPVGAVLCRFTAHGSLITDHASRRRHGQRTREGSTDADEAPPEHQAAEAVGQTAKTDEEGESEEIGGTLRRSAWRFLS